MKLYTYVVARDYGFAPNPFYGWCTLATCKPRIRSAARVGDWVIGTGAKGRYDLVGSLIFAMRVDEAITFNAYWQDHRFLVKRPVLNGSLKQLYGDNIYHRENGRWKQADSHHSKEGGRANLRNIAHDTSVDRMLLSRRFIYFGEKAPELPKHFRPLKLTGEDICCPGQGHRVRSPELATDFVAWLVKQNVWGLAGMPLEFAYHQPSSI
jgi:hypothetical protein